MKYNLHTIRRSFYLAWGGAWRQRSVFITKALKEEANLFLNNNQEKMLFVTGTGRSGTQLISGLLNDLNNTTVFHEPNFNEDVGTMDILRQNQALAVRYWTDFRSIEVYRRWKKATESMVYSEVNGTIRYQAPTIKRLYPNAKMLLLVRDARGFVRSVMGWPKFYAPDAKGAFALAPLSGDPYEAEWSSMGRFEKICWGWQNSNELLMRHIPAENWFTLEQLTADFDYFNERFCQSTGLPITQETWEKHVSKKSSNATKQYAFPSWEQWSNQQKENFIRICGSTMEKLGYAI